MDTHRIQQLSIASALYNFRVLKVANLPSDQARQLFQLLLATPVTDALSANAFYKDMDWSHADFLPALCRLVPFKALLATAADVPPNALSFSLALEFLYKLGAAIWRHELPTLTYPTVTPDLAARNNFKSSFQNNNALNNLHYPLDSKVISLIANIIDVYHIRGFQKLELNALNLSSNDPLDILKNQPRFSVRLLKEIQTFIGKAVNAPPVTNLYAAIVHGYVDAPSETPAQTSSYVASVASLVKEYLLTGVKPHQGAGHQWTSLQLSLYEDTQPGTVSASDLLKPGPINYSDFRLHAFLSISLPMLDEFLERIDRLLFLYQADIERYWRAPSADTGAKKIWAGQIKHYIETEARLRVADNTLDITAHALINKILSHPTTKELNGEHQDPPITVHTCSFVDALTTRAFPINGTFLIESEEPGPSGTKPIVTFTFGAGAEVFGSWDNYVDAQRLRMTTTDGRYQLFKHLAKSDALAILDFYSLQPAQLALKKIPVTSNIIDTMIDGLLLQQKSTIDFNFTQARKAHLPTSLEAFCGFLDDSLDLNSHEPHTRLVSLRHARLMDHLSNQAVSYALARFEAAPQEDFSRAHLAPPTFNLPEPSGPRLTDSTFRGFMLDALGSDNKVNAVNGILGNIAAYFPAEMPMSREFNALTLQKVIAHRLALAEFDWQAPNSHRYKYYALRREHRRQPNAKPLVDSACLALLGTRALPSEMTYPYYSSAELETAEETSAALVPTLHREIGGGQANPDLQALGVYLNLSLLADDDTTDLSPGQHTLDDSLYYELLLDLPAFNSLGRTLADAAAGSTQTNSPSANRALAVAVITDYLYPAAEQKPGYICGLNLNSVTLGESTIGHVRRTLLAHLKHTFANAPDADCQRFAFTLLCMRYAPELLIVAPRAELYGQTLAGVHLRHAVACMEAIQPCSSLGLTHQEIATYYSSFHYDTLDESQKIALALLKQLPTLHFVMCQGVIPQTDIADVTHDDSLKAAEYIQQQEDQEATAFTHLAQIPPQRKEMATQAFKASFPGKDPQQITRFSTAEVNKYFFRHPVGAADSGIGRQMKMTLLEKYMTCTAGLAFTEEEVGLGPSRYTACSIQALFDQRFDTYKANFLSGMVSRMSIALHGLPRADRERILNAYKYIKVSFKNDQEQWESAHFGLIALYKETDQIQYAYEIFCPSGTVRPLRLDAAKRTRIDAQFSPDSRDELWHESPYLNIRPLDQGAYLRGIPGQDRSTPKLVVGFYTLRRQTQHMTRAEKIQFLSQKMVDSVFSNVVELAYPSLRSPTPFEVHKERLHARAVAIARFIFPGYALYQDIKSGKVTAGTIIFGTLEALAILLPFVGLGIKALSVSSQLARLAITVRSIGFSKSLLAAARAIKPLQNALPGAFLRSAKAANPAGAAVLLFQMGNKGMLAMKYLLKFARQELGGGAHLSRLVKLKHLPPIESAPPLPIKSVLPNPILRSDDIRLFRPSLPSTGHHLNIQQQRTLYASGVDLSDVVPVNEIYRKQEQLFIYFQNTIYAVRKLPGGDRYRIYKGDIEGPDVKLDPTSRQWRIIC